MEYLDVDTMVKGFRPEEDLPLPSGAGVVRIRPIGRNVAVAITLASDENDQEKSVFESDVHALQYGLVRPKLTREQAEAYRENGHPADVQAIVQRLNEISSLDENAPKGHTAGSRRTRR